MVPHQNAQTLFALRREEVCIRLLAEPVEGSICQREGRTAEPVLWPKEAFQGCYRESESKSAESGWESIKKGPCGRGRN